MVALVLVVAVAIAGLIGWVWSRGDGTLQPGTNERILPADVRLPDGAFGAAATLLLFTSQQDDRGAEVRARLRRVAGEHRDVAVAEVDLTRHGDLAGRYAVTRTPGVFALDGEGRLRARVRGAGDTATLRRALLTALA